MDVAGWEGGTTDLCPGRQKPSRRHWVGDVLIPRVQNDEVFIVTDSEANYNNPDPTPCLMIFAASRARFCLWPTAKPMIEKLFGLTYELDN